MSYSRAPRAPAINLPPTNLSPKLTHVLSTLTVVALGLLLFAEPCNGAPVTYVRNEALTSTNLTVVLEAVPSMIDSKGCSMLCKKNGLCGGFTLDVTGCTLYGVTGSTFPSPIGVLGVGFFPTA